MRCLVVIFLFISVVSLKAQENLVPNPSFEEYVGCPHNSGQIDGAMPWVNVRGSCDYYHECGTNGYSIPVSWGGGGDAHSGQAYIGVAAWAYTLPNAREYAGVFLTTALIPGKKYNVEFYVSLLDTLWYGVKNMGTYFSIGQPPSNTSVLLSYEPQVKYTGEAFLSEKESWTKIEGSFIAQGGENFITIGNFDDDNNTDTLFVGGGIPDPYDWRSAGYFIDDVSVTLDTLTGISELEKINIDVYPNPAKNEIYVSINGNQNENIDFELWNMLGQNVKAIMLKPGMNIVNTNGLSVGVYHYVVKLNGERKKNGKQVIIQ